MVTGACFRFVHDLVWHEWAGVSLWRWLLLAVLAAAGFILLGVLPGGPWLSAATLLVFAALILSRRWAQARFYVVFRKEQSPASQGDAPAPLSPVGKVQVRATGLFGVEGREAPWTDLLAYYRTFATGEHAIMARRTPSRFLRCAEREPENLGMWYLFLTPETLHGIVPGQLHFGAHPRPALRLHYTRTTPKGKQVPAVAYLSFDTPDARHLVAADLGRSISGPKSGNAPAL